MDFYCISNSRLIENSLDILEPLKNSGIDIIHELSARTCYKSLHDMETNDGFLNSLVQRGHNDVFEHGMIQIAIDGAKDLDKLELAIRRKNQYARIEQSNSLFDSKCNHLRVFASFRVWSDLATSGIFDEDEISQIREILFSVAPKSCMWESKIFTNSQETKISIPSPQSIELLTGAKIFIIAKSVSMDTNCSSQSSATILFDGVSRSLTHQLVRHRRGSFSQESQRYVSLSKMKKDDSSSLYVTPPSVNFTSKEKYDKIIQGCLDGYDLLTNDIIAPEDARFVLQNAMRTKIVVTMTMDDWQHFIWLRALDNAAQWEIREAAQGVLKLFEHHMYPFALNEVNFAYESGIFDEEDNFRKILVARPLERMIKSRGAARKARKGKKNVYSN